MHHTHVKHTNPQIINLLSLLPGQLEETLSPEPQALLQNLKLRRLKGYLKDRTSKVCLGDATGQEDPDRLQNHHTIPYKALNPGCAFLSVLDPTGPSHRPDTSVLTYQVGGRSFFFTPR